MNPLDNPTLRRLLLTAAGVATVALNKKFALGLEAPELAAIAGMVIASVTGSNWKEAALAKADAAGASAAAQVTPDNAASIVKGVGQ